MRFTLIQNGRSIKPRYHTKPDRGHSHSLSAWLNLPHILRIIQPNTPSSLAHISKRPSAQALRTSLPIQRPFSAGAGRDLYSPAPPADSNIRKSLRLNPIFGMKKGNRRRRFHRSSFSLRNSRRLPNHVTVTFLLYNLPPPPRRYNRVTQGRASHFAARELEAFLGNLKHSTGQCVPSKTTRHKEISP